MTSQLDGISPQFYACERRKQQRKNSMLGLNLKFTVTGIPLATLGIGIRPDEKVNFADCSHAKTTEGGGTGAIFRQ
jgi:hypothetical protein